VNFPYPSAEFEASIQNLRQVRGVKGELDGASGKRADNPGPSRAGTGRTTGLSTCQASCRIDHRHECLRGGSTRLGLDGRLALTFDETIQKRDRERIPAVPILVNRPWR
jgi:hypothetical protein